MLKWANALIYLILRDQAQLTGPFITSVFSHASHLSSKTLRLRKGLRQGQKPAFMTIPAEDWGLLSGPGPRTSNVWQTSVPGRGQWDFMPHTSVCISKEAMVVTVIPVVACTAIGHRSPQSSLPLILVTLFGYGTTHLFSVAQTVVMEY